MNLIHSFFSGLRTKTIYKIRIMSEKVYNKHINIIVTLSGIQYHVKWISSYHRITRDAIYHMTLKLFCKHVFGVKTLTFAI